MPTVMLPANVQKPWHPITFSVFMLSSTADALGVDYRPSFVLAQLAAAPPQAEQDAARRALLTISPDLYVTVESGPEVFGATWAWALLGLTALIALASATIAIGLARADGQRDDAVLTSLGASPRVRRAFGFWQAIVIAGVGSVIGVLLGLVPPLALSLPHDSAGHSMQAFAPPWLQLALTAVVLPAIIAIGSWLTARGTRVRFTSRSAID